MIASKQIRLLLIATIGCLVMNKSSAGQELRRYQPATPTVSPYLSLDRFNTGGLPNYYTLVRPLNRQRQVNIQTQRLQRQQGAALQQLQGAVQPNQQLPLASTGTGGRFLTSGARAVYRDTRQFYPTVTLRR